MTAGHKAAVTSSIRDAKLLFSTKQGESNSSNRAKLTWDDDYWCLLDLDQADLKMTSCQFRSPDSCTDCRQSSKLVLLKSWDLCNSIFWLSIKEVLRGNRTLEFRVRIARDLLLLCSSRNLYADIFVGTEIRKRTLEGNYPSWDGISNLPFCFPGRSHWLEHMRD